MKKKVLPITILLILLALIFIFVNTNFPTGEIPQKSPYSTLEDSGNVLTIDYSEPIDIINSSEDDNTRKTLMEFFSMPAYFEFGRGGDEPSVNSGRDIVSGNLVSEDLIKELERLSKLSGSEFQEEFDAFASGKVQETVQKSLNNPEITLTPYYVDEYATRYAPEFMEELKKENDLKITKAVTGLIEEELSRPNNKNSIIFNQRFIDAYVKEYAPEYLDLLQD